MIKGRKASRDGFKHRSPDEPLVPEVEGVDITPYQEWAQAKLGFTFDNPSLLITALNSSQLR